MLRFVLLAILIPASSFATVIDFDTDSTGAPFTGTFDSFQGADYRVDGIPLGFIDSNPIGAMLVFEANPHPYISGYHVGVAGMFDRTTYLEIWMSGLGVTELAFDFATRSGYLHVMAYDELANAIFDEWVLGIDSERLINQAGFPLVSGGMFLDGLGVITRLRIETASREALAFDNFYFLPNPDTVPEPSVVLLLAAGLVMSLAARRV